MWVAGVGHHHETAGPGSDSTACRGDDLGKPVGVDVADGGPALDSRGAGVEDENERAVAPVGVDLSVPAANHHGGRGAPWQRAQRRVASIGRALPDNQQAAPDTVAQERVDDARQRHEETIPEQDLRAGRQALPGNETIA